VDPNVLVIDPPDVNVKHMKSFIGAVGKGLSFSSPVVKRVRERVSVPFPGTRTNQVLPSVELAENFVPGIVTSNRRQNDINMTLRTHILNNETENRNFGVGRYPTFSWNGDKSGGATDSSETGEKDKHN
jgi:hypothetical protein